jgi:TatD DNase family protein
MYLYNIHTHKAGPQEIDGYKVQYILNTSPEDFEEKILAPDNIRFSCGIHPRDADNAGEQLMRLNEIVQNKSALAIGEAGLDKLKDTDMKVQEKVFRQQIELAISISKPLIIHCVKAWDILIALRKEYKSDIQWIIHGYRGNVEQTKQLVQFGFKFSVGEFFNEDAIRYIPLDSLFCETDMSEISICKVYEIVSTVLNIPFNQFVEIIADNMRFSSK